MSMAKVQAEVLILVMLVLAAATDRAWMEALSAVAVPAQPWLLAVLEAAMVRTVLSAFFGALAEHFPLLTLPSLLAYNPCIGILAGC